MGPPARDLRYGWFAVSRAKGPMLLPTREEAPADPQRKQKQRHTLQFIRANQPQTNGGYRPSSVWTVAVSSHTLRHSPPTTPHRAPN